MEMTCQLVLRANYCYMQATVYYLCHTDPRAISDTLSQELELCNEWLIDNRLSLHLGKTEAILCGTKRKMRNIEDFEVKYKGNTIEYVSEVKHLGIKIDITLS